MSGIGKTAINGTVGALRRGPEACPDFAAAFAGPSRMVGPPAAGATRPQGMRYAAGPRGGAGLWSANFAARQPTRLAARQGVPPHPDPGQGQRGPTFLAATPDAMRAGLFADVEQAVAGAPEPERAAADVLRTRLSPRLLHGLNYGPETGTYRRNVIHRGESTTFIAIRWDHRQHSPDHSHNVWCAFGVPEGGAAVWEQRFVHGGAGRTLVDADWIKPGGVSFGGATTRLSHVVSNPGRNPAYTLHIYNVGLTQADKPINHLWPKPG